MDNGMFKVVCDICLENMTRDEGYVLTTWQVLTCKDYWMFAIPRLFPQLDSLPKDAADRQYQQQVGRLCSQTSGWMTCNRCIDLFPDIDRQRALQYANGFWKAVQDGTSADYAPPGCEAVDPSEIGAVSGAVWEEHTGRKAPTAATADGESLRQQNGDSDYYYPDMNVPEDGKYVCRFCGPNGILSKAMHDQRTLERYEQKVAYNCFALLSLSQVTGQPCPIQRSTTVKKQMLAGAKFPECPECGSYAVWELADIRLGQQGCMFTPALQKIRRSRVDTAWIR